MGGKLPASGKLASGFSKLFNRKGKSKAKDSESGLINPRPDILSPRDPAETHPSEHPAIVLLNYASAADMRAAREKMSAKRLNDDRDALSSGSASGWQELVAQIRSTQADTPHKAAYGARRTIDATSIAHNQCVSVSTFQVPLYPNRPTNTLLRASGNVSRGMRNRKKIPFESLEAKAPLVTRSFKTR